MIKAMGRKDSGGETLEERGGSVYGRRGGRGEKGDIARKGKRGSGEGNEAERR